MTARSMAQYVAVPTTAAARTCAQHPDQQTHDSGGERAECTECGCILHAGYITRQPRLPGAPQYCGACVNAANSAIRAERKAERAAARASAPPCMAHTCARKASTILRTGATVNDDVALCRTCARLAQRANQRARGQLGGLGLFLPIAYTRARILDLIEEERHR